MRWKQEQKTRALAPQQQPRRERNKSNERPGLEQKQRDRRKTTDEFENGQSHNCLDAQWRGCPANTSSTLLFLSSPSSFHRSSCCSFLPVLRRRSARPSVGVHSLSYYVRATLLPTLFPTCTDFLAPGKPAFPARFRFRASHGSEKGKSRQDASVPRNSRHSPRGSPDNRLISTETWTESVGGPASGEAVGMETPEYLWLTRGGTVRFGEPRCARVRRKRPWNFIRSGPLHASAEDSFPCHECTGRP